MPKRRRQQDMLEPCRTATKRRPQEQRHVYLVVDDWERGYSVRKIDVDGDEGFFFLDDPNAAADVDLDEAAEPLPEPPVVRFNASHCCLYLFGGHGTNILAIPVSSAADGAFPVFDTKTLELNLCAHPGGHKVHGGKPFFASVAGKLYMVDISRLCVLGAPPPPPPPCTNEEEHMRWSWTTITSTFAPIRSNLVTSSALHPDGQTLFVSGDKSTFSLDTESLEWTWRGNWRMPFQGQAYFDHELDAWVGLCRHKNGLGYLCCCDVVPKCGSGSSTTTTMPAWKLGKDQLFYADETRHQGATLLSLGGGGGDYCLIESLVHKVHDPERGKRIRGQRRRVLYVTRFGLKYDKNGELRTTRRRARSYEMTEAHELNDLCFTPVAFLM